MVFIFITIFALFICFLKLFNVSFIIIIVVVVVIIIILLIIIAKARHHFPQFPHWPCMKPTCLCSYLCSSELWLWPFNSPHTAHTELMHCVLPLTICCNESDEKPWIRPPPCSPEVTIPFRLMLISLTCTSLNLPGEFWTDYILWALSHGSCLCNIVY